MDAEIKKRIKILSRHLGVPRGDIRCPSDRYVEGVTDFEVEMPSETFNGLAEDGSPIYREYAVFTAKEADSAITDKLVDIIESKGLDAFKERGDDDILRNLFLEGGLEWEMFEKEAWNYAYDLAQETYDDDPDGFYDLCIERYLISEDDFDEETGEYVGGWTEEDLVERLANEFLDEYKDEYDDDMVKWYLERSGYDKNDVRDYIRRGEIPIYTRNLKYAIEERYGFGWLSDEFPESVEEVGDYYIIQMSEYM